MRKTLIALSARDFGHLDKNIIPGRDDGISLTEYSRIKGYLWTCIRNHYRMLFEGFFKGTYFEKAFMCGIILTRVLL
jgi:hypothetical protein